MRVRMVWPVLVMNACVLVAQAPPVKMGLWEKTLTLTGGPRGTMTLKAKNCITPDTWQEMVTNSTKPQPGCTINKAKTAKGYSFSGSCTISGGTTMEIKGSSSINDEEHITSDSHSTITRGGKITQSDTHSTSQFVSANCGAVKPGEPEVER